MVHVIETEWGTAYITFYGLVPTENEQDIRVAALQILKRSTDDAHELVRVKGLPLYKRVWWALTVKR